jgi:hypothetical protein
MQERRKLSRWQVNKPASIKFEGAVAFASCLLKDINFKGLQLALPLKLDVDSYVSFCLKVNGEFSLDCQAWVAWHKAIETHNIYGMLFTRIKDADKENIYKFVYQNVPHEIANGWWKDPTKKEGGEKMDDRRIFQRFNIRFPVKILDLSNGMELIAETSDVSAKGMGLMLKEEVSPNTPLEAWLKIPDKGEPLYTRGTAVWSRKDDSGDFRLGVDLERADLMGLSRILRA